MMKVDTYTLSKFEILETSEMMNVEGGFASLALVGLWLAAVQTGIAIGNVISK